MGLGLLGEKLITSNEVFPNLRQEEEIRYIIQKINSDSSLNPETQMNDKPFAVCKMKSEMLKEVIINRDNTDKKTKIESLLKNHSFEGTKVVLQSFRINIL